MKDEYPDGISEVTVRLGDDYPGLVLPSIIGNVDGLLMCSNEVKDVILEHDVGEIEVVPFVLLNHRGRVHSRDYVFVNPVGTVDCLNLSACDIFRHTDGTIGRIDKFVLDANKTGIIRELFRPQEDPGEYFFSEKLAFALQSREFTNLYLRELEIK